MFALAPLHTKGMVLFTAACVVGSISTVVIMFAPLAQLANLGVMV